MTKIRRTALNILAVMLVCVTALCTGGCGGGGQDKAAISQETAKSILQSYLTGKGFAEGDFLAEGNIMVLDGEKVYAFS